LYNVFSIDASIDDGRLGRLINDAKTGSPECNAIMKLIDVKGQAKLFLFALQDIKVGEEICYDYGEKEKKLWWRALVS
jgi:SET domain-containing protein